MSMTYLQLRQKNVNNLPPAKPKKCQWPDLPSVRTKEYQWPPSAKPK